MKQIDLDDLPPRAAKALAGLVADEELTLVQGGVVIGRVVLARAPSTPAPVEPPDEAGMAEVMDHFNAMIHDEF
ncbi:MAG: hypothetical protein H0X27_00030 [Caulobacteraceae bacterium]|nr:hypothetical protein [Caulobacteraceae bacterium]